MPRCGPGATEPVGADGSRLGAFRDLAHLVAREADGPIRLRLAVALALAAAGSVLTGLAPLALQHLIDAMQAASTSATASGALATLLFGAAYLLALAAGRVLAELRLMLAGQAEQHLHARLSSRYFAHLLSLPLGFHIERPTGALTNSLSHAAAGCQLGLNSIMQCLPIVIELATVLFVLTHLGEPALAAIFAASAVAYGLVFAHGASRVRAHGRTVAQAGLQLHATLADSLLNIEAIKCFNASGAMLDRFERTAHALERHWAGLYRQRARTGLLAALLFAASVAASLFVAGQAVAAGTLTIGGFVLATVCMLQMVRPLEQLGAAVRDLAQAIEFARPLLDVMHTAPEVAATSPPRAVPRTDGGSQATEACGHPPEIVFDDVHLAYQRGRPILNGFSLQVAAGSTVAILGASGAGKSSILRLLLRLQGMPTGRILWNRHPIEQMDVEALRRSIAIVPQDTTLFCDTIAANIAIGRPGASRADIEEAARRAQLHTFIASLPAGYDTPVGERGLKLSGGERQRIAIARAVLRRPQVYVFDEVSSMLDGPTEAALLGNLREICAGCTTLFVTHRLAAAREADQIVVLRDGRVAEQGTHSELLSRDGPYRRQWQAQGQGTLARSRQRREAAAEGTQAPPSHAFARRLAVRRRPS